MPPPIDFLFDTSLCGPPLLPGGTAPKLECTLPAYSSNVCKPQELERFRLAKPSPPSFPAGEPPELQDPGFLRVELQTELCVRLSLKAHHEVIRIAHDVHLTLRLLPPPLTDPEVEHVVQVDVGHQGADDSTLGRSFLHRV
jgi:hypothetical protein